MMSREDRANAIVMLVRAGIDPRNYAYCAKCGTFAYHGREYRAAPVVLNGQHLPGEYIVRRCRECGYAFAEPCADAPGVAE